MRGRHPDGSGKKCPFEHMHMRQLVAFLSQPNLIAAVLGHGIEHTSVLCYSIIIKVIGG
jgi:hypothetical protein